MQLRHRHRHVFRRDVLQHQPVDILVRVDHHAVEHAALEPLIGLAPGDGHRRHAKGHDRIRPDGPDGAGALALGLVRHRDRLVAKQVVGRRRGRLQHLHVVRGVFLGQRLIGQHGFQRRGATGGHVMHGRARKRRTHPEQPRGDRQLLRHVRGDDQPDVRNAIADAVQRVERAQQGRGPVVLERDLAAGVLGDRLFPGHHRLAEVRSLVAREIGKFQHLRFKVVQPRLVLRRRHRRQRQTARCDRRDDGQPRPVAE